MNITKIVFIVGVIQQPRIIKRIKSLVPSFNEIVVYGYIRPSYKLNIPTDINFINLGEQQDGKNYFLKLKSLYFDINKIVEQHNDEGTIFYCTNPFAALFLRRRRVPYIYEISDILYAYPKFKRLERFLKSLDKKNIKNSVATLLTSEGFLNYFNLLPQNISNVIVQPNKLSPILSKYKRDTLSLKDDKIKFAFIGAVRYRNTVLRFAENVGEHFKNHEFHFYGEGVASEDAKLIVSRYDNVFYHGPYKNPDDLPSIYESIDVVVACYETESENERIAEPNKLYESLYFCKPIIVSKNTFLAKQVEKYNGGFIIDASKDEEIISFINNINIDNLSKISARQKQIPSKELIDNPQEFIDKIKEGTKLKK